MNKIIINVHGSLNRFIKKCIEKHINIVIIKYLDNDSLIARIDYKDYKLVKKSNYYSDIRVVKYEGLEGFKMHIKKYLYAYLIIIYCFIVMDVLTSYIIKIDVIHENSNIRKRVINELKDHGIDKYTLAYSFEGLEKIKNEILKDNPNNLEWMSITRDGMKYVVRIEERIIKKEKIEDRPRDIIANKDALITKIISTKGEPLVRAGDYVKKGDTLISGKIMLYDEVKGYTSATGNIYGNVWYEALIKVPLEKEEIIKTGKSRYNLNFNNKIFLKNKYKYFYQDNIKELKVLGLKIKIYKEVEYNKKISKISLKDADKIAFEKIDESFSKKIGNNGKVISKKVLKKIENDSKIEYRIFVVTNELISKYFYLNEGDISDSGKSN